MAPGSFAITPRINARIPLLPTFTREDVATWADAQTVGLGRMIALEPFTIGKTVFSSAWRIHRLFHASTGLPWLAPACYVEFHGRFDAPHPYGTTPRVVTRAWAVFDGRTGNLLMAGGNFK